MRDPEVVHQGRELSECGLRVGRVTDAELDERLVNDEVRASRCDSAYRVDGLRLPVGADKLTLGHRLAVP